MGYSYLVNGVPSSVQRPPGASSPSAFILKNVQSSELLPLSPFPSKALCVGCVLSSPTLPSPAQGLLTFLPSLSCIPLEMRFLESPIRDSVQMGFQGASCLEQASHPSPPPSSGSRGLPPRPEVTRAGVDGICPRAALGRPLSPSSHPPRLSPKYFKKVPGEGMPLPEEPARKGDLFIFFDIQFPTRLTPQKKQMLRQALLT